MNRIFKIGFFFLMITSVLALPARQSSANREKMIGNIVKNFLETYHYRDMSIDDKVSQKAFKEFLKKVDYSKQFLLASEVRELEKFQFLMDDQMINGNHALLNKTIKILERRVKHIDQFRTRVFKKQFNFNKKEYLELDPKKRKHAKTIRELEETWRKTFKQAVLNRYLSYADGEDEEKKKDKKKDKKKKKEKKMTDAEMRKKSHEVINKKYEDYLARVLKEDRTDYMEKFFNSLAGIYDPHTVYMPPKRKEDFDIDISGKLEGIGAVLQEDGPYIKVVRIVPGGAAWRQKGLKADDVILMVGEKDGEPVDLVDMRVDDAVRYIRGKKGTEVRLTVKKPDGTRQVIPIIRDVVEIEASYAKGSVLEHKDLGIKVGYIHVPKFYRDFSDANKKNCTEDVRIELESLKKQKVNGIILDLRNNGGGALEDARKMSGLFIKKGPIVQTKNYTGQIDVLKDNNPSVTYDGPLIIMVNRFSASASEILAGALQDYKRAVIVGGEFSHGKGTVQAVLDLNNGPLRSLFSTSFGALKVTIQKFYRINGRSTQYKGVTPDIIFPDPLGYADNREQDLDYSLPWDKVAPQKYDLWKNFSYDLGTLKKRSRQRVSKNKSFEKIRRSVEYLTKRRDQTKVSLNIKEVRKEDEQNKKISEDLKLDYENKKVLVSHIEESLRRHEKIRPGDEKQWREDFEERKKDWIKTMQKDPAIEETLFIMDDVINQVQGKKYSAI